MTKNIIITAAVLFFAALTTHAQNLHVKCGFAGLLGCDGREIVVTLYNPSCGTIIGSTNPKQIFVGDDYTINLPAIWPGTFPTTYEIYSIEVREWTSCSLTVGPGPNACGYENGVTVGHTPCTGYNTTECYELTGPCSSCVAGQMVSATYTRNALGDVLLEID